MAAGNKTKKAGVVAFRLAGADPVPRGEVLLGRRELAKLHKTQDPRSKQYWIAKLMKERGWGKSDVLFLDDTQRNIRALAKTSAVMRVKGNRGINPRDVTDAVLVSLPVKNADEDAVDGDGP